MIQLAKKQPTLFESERMSFEDALEMTAVSLRAYALRYKHWAIAYSGGKDSSALVAAVIMLIMDGRVPAPESLTVLNSDTRMELPPLQASAMRMLEVVREKGFKADVVWPELDEQLASLPFDNVNRDGSVQPIFKELAV